MTSTFDRKATVTASTKRSPAEVAGKVTVPVAYLSNLKVWPLSPMTPEIALQYRIRSPRDGYKTYTTGTPDILEGDRLVIGTVEYIVRGANPFADATIPHVALFLELVR